MSMRDRLNVFSIFLAFIISQKACKGIDCYQYSSIQDMCNSYKVDSKYLRSCPETHNYCRTAVYVHYFTGSQKCHIIRECARLGNEEKECYKGRYIRDSYQYICECKESGCNRSSTSGSYLPAILASQLTVFVFCITCNT